MNRLIPLFAALTLLLVAAAWWLTREKPTAGREAEAAPAPARTDPKAPPASDDGLADARRRIAERQRNRPNADRTRRRLRNAIPPREVDPANASPKPRDRESKDYPIGDKEFFREVINDQIIPVVRDCYQLELESQPDLTGKITVTPTIVADEDIGGVVEDVVLHADETKLDSPGLQECVLETTRALEFEPPERGRGRQDVTFTIVFADAETDP